MPYPVEQNEKFAAYAQPERLVSTEWLAAAIDAGALADGKLVVCLLYTSPSPRDS